MAAFVCRKAVLMIVMSLLQRDRLSTDCLIVRQIGEQLITDTREE